MNDFHRIHQSLKSFFYQRSECSESQTKIQGESRIVLFISCVEKQGRIHGIRCSETRQEEKALRTYGL